MSANRLPKTRRPASSAAFAPPYPASWFDHFKGWVERLPIPWWLFYVIVAAILEGVQGMILSRECIFRVYDPPRGSDDPGGFGGFGFRPG